jgi:alanyl-tRNA synthetase
VDLRSDEERKSIDGKTLVNKDHPQVIEIWNNVFMQFNRMKDGSLVELPARHVDTGMGLERLVRAIQGKQSNYDSDVFQDLIRELCLLTNNSYGKDEKTDIACRVIVDHIRAIAFTIADGQLPSNGGAGYVIRRILRRAVRYGFTYLGQEQPFIHKLLPFLANQMDTVFPELKAQLNFVSKVVFEEESSFLRTLGTGIKRFNALVDDGLVVNNEISGQQAFDLYDTYGFPFDLTRLMAQEAGLNINEADFEVELQKQKTRSRKAAEVDQGDWVNVLPDEEEEFIGYDSLESDIKIVKYRKIKQKDKEQYHLVFNHTPFYAEGGGQVGDTGVILSVNDRIQIVDTKKENNLIIHFADELPGKLESDFNALVDVEKRQDTQRNHSATHLLHRALREVLGKHVEQRGSLVNDQYLRFDFSHFQKISAEEMTRIESMVNAEIRANLPLNERRQMPIDQAKALGAMALFGEKYGDSVRVIQFGESVELCGGTHVKHTGEIGLLKVISESSVAAGIRRIEAVTGANAIKYFEEKMQLLEDLSLTIGQTKDIVQAVKNLKEENEALKADLEKVAAEKAMEIKGWLKNQSNNLSDITFIGETIELGNAEHIKNLAFQLRNEVPNLVMAIGAVVNDKALLTVIIDDALVSSKGWNAGKMIKEVSPLIKGGGGGQPFYATAGGANPEGMTAAIAKIKEMISA